MRMILLVAFWLNCAMLGWNIGMMNEELIMLNIGSAILTGIGYTMSPEEDDG